MSKMSNTAIFWKRILSVAAFHAKTSAQQDRNVDSAVNNQDSGTSSHASSPSSIPKRLSSKMSRHRAKNVGCVKCEGSCQNLDTELMPWKLPHEMLASPIDENVSSLWPTTTAGDQKSSGSRCVPGSHANAGTSLTDAVVRTLPNSKDFALNAAWVDTLMGFPIGWSDLPRVVEVANTHGSHLGSYSEAKPTEAIEESDYEH